MIFKGKATPHMKKRYIYFLLFFMCLKNYLRYQKKFEKVKKKLLLLLEAFLLKNFYIKRFIIF